jgi:hypothetical protein
MPRGQMSGFQGAGNLADFQPEKPGIGGTGPGFTPEEPLDEQHPDLSWWERTKIMNFADNPDVAKRYLEQNGFQAVNRGGWNFSIKKPGETSWRVVDPSGWDLSDITDIGGDVATGVGAGIGATVGTVAGLPSGPGALATGTAGAALGAAGAQGLKSIAGQVLGMRPESSEVLSGMGREAAFGAGGQLVGKGVGKLAEAAAPYVKPAMETVGGWMKAPLRAPAAYLESKAIGPIGMEAKGKAISALQNIPEEVIQGMMETGTSRTAIEAAVKRASEPLASMGEVKQAAQSTFPAIQKMMNAQIEQMEPEIRTILADQIEGAADNEVIESTRSVLKELTKKTGRTAKLDAVNNAAEFLDTYKNLTLGQTEPMFKQGLRDYSSAGTELMRKANKPLSTSIGPMGTIAPLGLRTLTGAGALTGAGTLGVPGALVGGGMVGSSIVGGALQKAAPYAEMGAERFAASPAAQATAGTIGLGTSLGRLQSQQKLNPKLTSIYAQGLSPGVKKILSEYQQRFPQNIQEPPRTKQKQGRTIGTGLQ